MRIPRIATIDELRAMHRNAADEVEKSLSDLYVELNSMDRIQWRGSLRNRDVLNLIAATGHTLMIFALDAKAAQDDLERINKKLTKIRTKEATQ